jgi:hypothetical protein
MAKKKLKKAILAGLTAYAGAKMLGEKQKSDWITKNNAAVMSKREGKPHLDRFLDDPLTGDGKGMESVYKPKHFKKPEKKSKWDWLPDFFKWNDNPAVKGSSKGGSAKGYSGGGAINTRLNGKVKFRTY